MIVKTFDCGSVIGIAWKWRGKRHAKRWRLPNGLIIEKWRIRKWLPHDEFMARKTSRVKPKTVD